MPNEATHTEHMVDEQETFYEVFQMQRYGNVLPVDHADNEVEDAVDRMLMRLTAQYEMKLDDHLGY